MPQSMLIYQELPGAASVATVIGLHAEGGDVDQLVPLAGRLGPQFQLVAPQAARPTNPATQGYVENQGYLWFFIQQIGHPEPATFGESLWLLDRFIADVRERQGAGRPLVLVGYEQGAVLAATLAMVVPDQLAGVVAIGGYVPDIAGWSPPVENLQGLPVLLVHDPSDPAMPVELVERTAATLADRKAAVDVRPVPGVSGDILAAADLTRAWMERTLTQRAATSSD
jgi:phospholipase/carboxylesterase